MSYIDEISGIWEEVKLSFEKSLTKSVIDLWFGELKIVNFENNTIVFSTDSEFKYKIIKEKYLDTLKNGFLEMLGFSVDVDIRLTGKQVNSERKSPSFSEAEKSSLEYKKTAN